MAPRAYPDYARGNSIDSDRTASDATLDEHHPALAPWYRDDETATESSETLAHQRYPPRRTSENRRGRATRTMALRSDDEEDDDDPAEGKLRLDEEEEVGLMQLDRDGRSAATRASTRFFFGPRRKGRRAVASGGVLVFVGVIVGFALSLPLLQWLSNSSASGGPSPATPASIPKGGNASTTPAAVKFASSSNDASGQWGLAHATGFQLNFQDPGWATFSQSAAGTGLSESEVASFKGSNDVKLMPLDIDTVLGGTLRPQQEDLTWSAEDRDEGVFSHVDWAERDIWIEDVTHARRDKTGQGEVAPGGGKVLYVRGADVRDHYHRKLPWTRYKISPDMLWVMFFTNEQKQWRYSQHAHVWLHSIRENRTILIGGDGYAPGPAISYAAWAPLRQDTAPGEPPSLAYVQDNNLFFLTRPDALPIRVTHDGDESVFNAVPDWVYEEEVFAADSAMWFSPGGTKLIYLRFDESQVPIYEFPLYNPDPFNAGKTLPYLDTVRMKYPKPGYPNPLVSVHMVDLDEIHEAASKAGGAAIRSTPYVLPSPRTVVPVEVDRAAHKVDVALTEPEAARQRLVTEVSWLNDDELLVRETDRPSDVMRLVLYQLGSVRQTPGASASGSSARVELQGQVVRREDARKPNVGWIRAAQTIEPLTHHNLSLKASAYLDVVVSPQGYRHLALFEKATADKPIFLTEGEWEVAELSHVDAKRRKAFFLAARPTPAERHLYAVSIPDWSDPVGLGRYRAQAPEALTDDTKPAVHGANFDPKGAYYVLNYQGPDVPFQKVVGVDDPTWEFMLEDNGILRNISSQYVRPQSVFYNLTLDATMGGGSTGVPVSVKEIRPHDFDASGATRYPVLVQVYGGPDSQVVSAKWDRPDWHQYLAASLGYIVCHVDGRGTGFRGQAYRASVARNLGYHESRDVVQAAKMLASLPYVDESKLGIWGWSYGGYLTNKVLERNSHAFSLGIAVAPVTKWEFYDSIYTERYLKLPSGNPAGYFNASVHVAQGHASTPLLLAQGSGDDNVHFSHSAHLLDLLTKAKVRNFRFRMFTDSDHSISMRGAYRELYEELTRFLREHWGPGGKRGGK